MKRSIAAGFERFSTLSNLCKLQHQHLMMSMFDPCDLEISTPSSDMP
jgi:hypothetical protein